MIPPSQEPHTATGKAEPATADISLSIAKDSTPSPRPVDLWLDGSASPETSIAVDNEELLDAIGDDILFDVEVVPEAGEYWGSPPVALVLHGDRVGHLDPDLTEDMHPLIVQANALGFVVRMRARMHAASWGSRRLETRGTWPSDLHAWLSLPAPWQGQEFFEIQWTRTLWGNEFQRQRQTVLNGERHLSVECRVELCSSGGAFDVYVSSIHVGTVVAGYSDDCENAVERVQSGQQRGYARLRRLESGHIVVGVSVPEPISALRFRRSSEPFLWPDERDALENAYRERVEQARLARQVDGKDIRAWFEEVKALKRADRLADAAALLLRMLDAEDAAAAIIKTDRIRWITDQAAIVFRKLGDLEAEVAVLQRYLMHFPPGRGPAEITARLARAQAWLASS